MVFDHCNETGKENNVRMKKSWKCFEDGDVEQSMHVQPRTANRGRRMYLQSIVPLSL